ncbi:hypothetical protein DMB38_00675 [Streptomyces sp. WAC 06738]|uniref:hypothetical protein n=1 Tax=Streptomyces sp. WAC 06738 TaxID=2203210 RepID=UPI000F6FE9ED|nr:hypothetical protein [Streptomyces sp. WAC 06738]AZM44520.1 hypothetical protein DMB38_00675 [Streptomyces sp. WAC 06738]
MPTSSRDGDRPRDRAPAAAPGSEALLRSGEFDPTAVQLRPTDLARRRRRRRVAAAPAAAAPAGAPPPARRQPGDGA